MDETAFQTWIFNEPQVAKWLSDQSARSAEAHQMAQLLLAYAFAAGQLNVLKQEQAKARESANGH